VALSPIVSYVLIGLFAIVWLLMGFIAGTIEESTSFGRRMLHALLGPLAVLVFVIPGLVRMRRAPTAPE
jgi:hypothetical protein